MARMVSGDWVQNKVRAACHDPTADSNGRAIVIVTNVANRDAENPREFRIGCSTNEYEATAGTRDSAQAVIAADEAVGQMSVPITMKGQCHR